MTGYTRFIINPGLSHDIIRDSEEDHMTSYTPPLNPQFYFSFLSCRDAIIL